MWEIIEGQSGATCRPYQLYMLTRAVGKDKATSDEIHPRTVLEAELKKASEHRRLEVQD